MKRATLALAAAALVTSPPRLVGQAAPPPCGDSTARALGRLAGGWRARTVFRTSGGAWDTTAAEIRIAPRLNGCLLEETLVGIRFGEPFQLLALWGAHGLDEPIQRLTVHSQHGLLATHTGRPDGAQLVLRDSQVVRGGTVHFEHVFVPFGADSMRFTSRRSTNGGATWTVSWYADYLRLIPSPAGSR